MDTALDTPEPRVPFQLLAIALSYIDRALRQIERAQQAYRADEDARERLVVEAGKLMPAELVATWEDFYDAMVFTIIAARSAVFARRLLVEGGLDVPPISEHVEIVALRDMEEHWDEWRTTAPESEGGPAQPWLALRSAGRRWAEATGGRRPDGWQSEMTIGGAGLWTLTSWSGVDIRILTSELVELRTVVEPLEIAAFEYEYVDDAAGAALVGDDWEAVRQMVSRGPMRDEVVRWRRDLLLAAATGYARSD